MIDRYSIRSADLLEEAADALRDRLEPDAHQDEIDFIDEIKSHVQDLRRHIAVWLVNEDPQ